MAVNLFKHLMPHEEAFTPLFREQAQCIARAADELRKMIGDAAAGQQHVTAIRDIEVAADAVARKIFIAANRTFNAPIDREDILALAHVLDDCVDLIEDAAKEIQRYGIDEFPAEMRTMADAVVEAAAVLEKVMPYLDSVGKDHRTIIALCEEVAGRRLRWSYVDEPRSGDHIWWISSTRRFAARYPSWRQQYDLRATLEEMLEQQTVRAV